MKKTVIILALLGFVSVGTMAFVDKGNDGSSSRDSELRHECRDWHGHHDDGRHYSRCGGCCGRERYRDYRRGYDCCGYRHECGACYHDRCTSADCHRHGELCPSCAKWYNSQKADDVYRRR